MSSAVGTLEPGSRHDLRIGKSPDAPDESQMPDEADGAFGYVHSYETSSRYDGPGLRAVLFVSGCLLRCSYCHNPDTWHLKDGTRISAQAVIDRLSSFASALRSLDGGLTISGGEPLVQVAFTRRILTAAKSMGLHTAIETSGFWALERTRHILQISTSSCSISRAPTLKPTYVSPSARLDQR